MKERTQIFWTNLLTCASLLIIILGGCFLLNLVGDIIGFTKSLDSNYQTPWFDNRWFIAPYTHLALSMCHSKYYVTTNAIGDIWVVKQIQYNSKKFWTIDYQIKKDDITTSR